MTLRVDRYDLHEVLARGGMATVHFARQRGAAGFRKAVAIKRMRPDLVHEREFVDLFLDEARLASRVRHPNVVSVTDVVLSGDELLLVMDYIHGASLSTLLAACARNEAPVPLPIAIAILRDVLQGLHAAHEARGEHGEPLGIVHRDVSPQNVLVGVDGVARVADFGIARAAGQMHRTEEGKTRGKAAYSAPEQLRGLALDRTVDVFAASAVLWELLVGRRVFEGENQAAVIAAALTLPIDPPGLHRPEVPEALDELVLRGLHRDPDKRPRTALELASALVKVVPPATPDEVGAWAHALVRDELARREAVVRRLESRAADEVTPAAPAATPLPAAPETSGPLPPARASGKRVAIALALTFVAAIVTGVVFAAARPPVARLEGSLPRPPVPEIPEASPEPTPSADVAPAASQARPASTSKGRPRPGQSARRCNPPYDLDAAGRKIFRVECL